MNEGAGEPDESTTPDDRPRPARQLIFDRAVASFAAAKLISTFGVWIYNLVAAVVVYEVSGSALLVGAVSIAQFTPQIFLAPWMGAIADRGHRRALLMHGHNLTGVGATALAGWIGLTGVENLTSAGPVIGSAFVAGLGFAISVPSMHAIVPALAKPSELSSVIAITQSPFTLARAAGPALGAVLLVTAGPAVAFGVAGACQFVLAAVVWRLPLRPVSPSQDTDRTVRGSLRYLRHDSAVALLLLGVIGVGFGVDPVITLSPSVAAGFGGGEQLVALLASAFGVGAGVMVVFIGQARHLVGQGRLGSGGLWVMAGSMIALAASPTPVFAVLSTFVGGMGMMAAITSLTTQIQQRIPENLRARVMALWAICFVGSRPLAAGLNGAIADWWSPQTALIVLAVLLAVVARVVRPRPRAPA